MNLKITLILTMIIFSSCINRPAFKSIYIYMMDTLVEITLPIESSDEFASVESIMQTAVDIVTVDSNKISSNIEAVEIDEFTYSLLRDEAEYFELSGGRFNATVITISSLYGFPDKEKSVPDIELLNEIKGYALGGRVKFWSRADGTFFAEGGGLKIDLSSFAKGAIVDKAVDYLKIRGVKNFIINAGGDLYASGLKDSRKWSVGITDPNNRRKYIKSLSITDKAVATSGVYERYFIADNGSKISHLFNGITGEPTDRYKSITVVADSTKEADAFSTIYFFMNEDEIKEDCLKNKMNVYIIDKSSNNLTTVCEFP